MTRPLLQYGSDQSASIMEMCKLLIDAGIPTTAESTFSWHHYTRVMQFQLRCCQEGLPGWNWKTDIDGKCGPQTWSQLVLSGRWEPEKPTPDGHAPQPSIETHETSPNQSSRGSSITHIVLHNTAGSFLGSVEYLCKLVARASAHLVISREGKTAQLVDFSEKAWHAGNARMNANSIGIELTATVSQRGFTPEMEAKCVAWCRWLMDAYEIPAENIGIHRWYRNTSCPGLIWPTDAEFLAWRKRHFGG